MTTPTQRGWCAMLAKLTSPMSAPEAAQAFVAMLPMLPKDDAAYNRDTLERAATREMGDTAIPNYDKLVRAFAEWRRESLPVQVRMGGSVPVAQLIAPKAEVTPEEIERVDRQVAELKAEFAASAVSNHPRIEPRYVDKLTLARSASPEVLAMRADYRAVLAMHNGKIIDHEPREVRNLPAV